MARFEGGWVKIYRRIASSDKYRNPFYGDVVSYALMHLLIEWANWEDGTEKLNGQKFHLKRGQLVTSLDELSSQFGVSKKIIRRALHGLEMGTAVGTQKGTHGTVITIYNYDEYQSTEESEGTPEGTSPGKGRARHGHYNEEEKNLRTEKIPPPPTPPDDLREVAEVTNLDDFKFRPVLSHAESLFNCTFDSGQIAKFKSLWSQNAQFTATELKRALDWIAAHPKARAETASPLLRCFFIKAAQADCRTFDKNVSAAIAGFKKMGFSEDAIIEEMSKNPDYDSKIMANFVRSKL